MKIFIMAALLSIQAYAFADGLDGFKDACMSLKTSLNSSRFEPHADAGQRISGRCSIQTAEISWSAFSSEARPYDNFSFEQIDKLHAACPGKLTIGAAMLETSLIGTAGTVKSHLVVWCYL